MEGHNINHSTHFHLVEKIWSSKTMVVVRDSRASGSAIWPSWVTNSLDEPRGIELYQRGSLSDLVGEIVASSNNDIGLVNVRSANEGKGGDHKGQQQDGLHCVVVNGNKSRVGVATANQQEKGKRRRFPHLVKLR
jgi:hypothetical protein